MQQRIQAINALGIPMGFRVYEGLIMPRYENRSQRPDRRYCDILGDVNFLENVVKNHTF